MKLQKLKQEQLCMKCINKHQHSLTGYLWLAAIGPVEELVVAQTAFTAAEEDFRSIFLLHTFVPVSNQKSKSSF